MNRLVEQDLEDRLGSKVNEPARQVPLQRER